MATKKKANKKVINKKSGTRVAVFLKLKSKISAINKKLDDLKSDAYILECDIIKDLETQKLERFDISGGSVSLKKTFVGNVKDKKKLFKYATSKKQMQLLNISLSQAAYREMIEDGKKLPFIEKFNQKKLSVGRKRKVK